MRGHDRIIEARMHGRAPSFGVYVELTAEQPWFDWREAKCPGFPVLWIEPGDEPSKLDLRCLIGMRVVIGDEGERDWRPVADACVKAGAADVYVFRRVDDAMAMVWHDKEAAHADHP